MDLDTSVALVSLAEAKEYLKIQVDTEDQIVQTLINDVCSWIQTYLGRNLVLSQKTEYYDGPGCEMLMLRRFPIFVDNDNPLDVRVDSLRVFAAETAISNDNLIVEKESGCLKSFNVFGAFPCGKANIKAKYSAGYSLSTMPHDIRMATKRLLDLHYRSGYSQRKLDIKSESVGDVNTTFSGGDLPKDVERLLAPYKMVSAAPNFAYAD